MSTEIFVRDLCGNVKSILSSCEIEEIKQQIKNVFQISLPIYNIRVFPLEEEGWYGFFVNNTEVNVRVDENIRVTVPLETYNRYIVDVYGDLDEKVSFVLYECLSNLKELRYTKAKTYYVDNKDYKVKFLGTPYNGTILISPFIDGNGRNLCKKLKKALMEGFSKNEVLKKCQACVLEEIYTIIEEKFKTDF